MSNNFSNGVVAVFRDSLSVVRRQRAFKGRYSNIQQVKAKP